MATEFSSFDPWASAGAELSVSWNWPLNNIFSSSFLWRVEEEGRTIKDELIRQVSLRRSVVPPSHPDVGVSVESRGAHPESALARDQGREARQLLRWSTSAPPHAVPERAAALRDNVHPHRGARVHVGLRPVRRRSHRPHLGSPSWINAIIRWKRIVRFLERVWCQGKEVAMRRSSPFVWTGSNCNVWNKLYLLRPGKEFKLEVGIWRMAWTIMIKPCSLQPVENRCENKKLERHSSPHRQST